MTAMVDRDQQPLSRRDRLVLDAIRDYTAEHGYPPSMREIGQRSGLSSTSSVSYRLTRLVARGYLRQGPHGRPRSVVVVDAP